MKKAPVKILWIIIVTGFACIFSIIQFSEVLKIISNRHQDIMDVNVRDIEEISEIKSRLYEHQSVLANHLLSDDAGMYVTYEFQEYQLMQELKRHVIDFSYKMKGGEREQIYHKVYSDIAGYEKNVQVIMEFSYKNEKQMAVYYNDNVLRPFLIDINKKFSDLEKMIKTEISNAEVELAKTIKLSTILRYVTIIIIVILILSCSFICVSITSNLEKYKVNLEQQLAEKNKTLQKHNERMLKLQDGIIHGMANLIESGDGETSDHTKRTSHYVGMIAKAARAKGLYVETLTDEYISRLKKVAPLHDIGKIRVLGLIMQPRKLTEEEYESIKIHAIEGGNVIRQCFGEIEDEKYIKMACNVATYHHEWWDGSGYGEHKSGIDIPLSARIMAIADVFDALVSKRCYKPAFSVDEAFSEIKNSSGTHFDPELVEVFLSIRPEIETYLASTKG